MAEQRSPKPCVVGSNPTRPVKFENKMIRKVKKFFSEVAVELKKVSWSTKQDLLDATWIILISSTFLGLFIWITDTILGQILGIII